MSYNLNEIYTILVDELLIPDPVCPVKSPMDMVAYAVGRFGAVDKSILDIIMNIWCGGETSDS